MITYGGQALDACVLDRNDEGRRSRVRDSEVETGVVGRHKETDYRNTADVEQQNTDVNAADGFREVAAWVLGFTGSNLGSR